MGSPRRIGISVEFHLPFKHHSEVVAGIHRYAEERGWITAIDEWVDATILDAEPASVPYDGVIARVGGRRLRIIEAASKAGVPLVNVRAMSPAADRLPGVFPDFEQIGRLKAEHLMSRGLRHFAYASRGPAPYAEMAAAFATTVAAAGHSITRIDIPDDDDETLAEYRSSTARIRGWLDRWELPIGVATGSASFARRLAQMCHARGWRVPRDVAIVAGSNEEGFCEKPRPSLTSVELGYERVGYEAARLLEKLMDQGTLSSGQTPSRKRRILKGSSAKPEHVILPPIGIVVRESTDFFSSSDPIITDAQAYIAHHYHSHLGVGDVAEHLCVSTKTLQNRFAAVLKRSVAQEIRRLRIETAKRELSSSERSIHEIAIRAGFTSNARMCAVFRREVGVSPSEYRSTRSVPRA